MRERFLREKERAMMQLHKWKLKPGNKKTGTVPVYLNVYDLTPMNGYAYWVGLGIYHSGVQVHDVEYGFGAHEYPSTGIFEVEPRKCPGFTFRKSILIGRTDLGPKEVRALMEKLAQEYTGNTYRLITKNCNHFCNDVCIKLTRRSIPPWVNRLARLGFLCNCVLPPELSDKKIRQVRAEDRVKGRDMEKLRSHSTTALVMPSSLSCSLPTIDTGSPNIKKTRRRHFFPGKSTTTAHEASTSSRID